MINYQEKIVCVQCGSISTGKYCSDCGQDLRKERLTVIQIIKDVFKYFTKTESSQINTLKTLLFKPGFVQRDYILGVRGKYQSPHSFFFLTGGLTAIAIYYTHTHFLAEHQTINNAETVFTRNYFVLTQFFLLPFYSLFTWLLFKSKKFNYAESLVYFSYTLSIIFILILVTSILNVFHLNISHDYYEFPLMTAYLFWTNYNYFKGEGIWSLIIKSLIIMLLGDVLFNVVSYLVIHHLMS